MARRKPDAKLPSLRALAERCQYDSDFDAWLSTQGWSWTKLEQGDYGLGLEEALFLFVWQDPVRWCEAHLVEPRTGEPWSFFDYQKTSIRAWRQDRVHQDGAEVGKTREIMCLVLWGMITSMGFTVRRPWMLIGAPQQTHLDEIILAVEEQVGVQEAGEKASGSILSQFWLKPKRTPHMMQRFATIPLGGENMGVGRVYYRPAGHDGEAFRGVHVNAMALMDESAKIKRAVIWSEFWRSAMPGCAKGVYSVPDGDRSTDFFRLSQQAVRNLPTTDKGWRLFRWPKTMMPPPFWTEERDTEFVKLYGSRQAPGYVRNVLGEWGDAESPVFGWDLLMPNILDLPEFRIVRLQADRVRGELAITVATVQLLITTDQQTGRPRKAGQDRVIFDTAIDLDPFLARDDDQRRRAMRALVGDCIAPIAGNVFWGGIDFGETHDPTEIILSQEIGHRLRDELRVSVKGLPYIAQAELIHALDDQFGQKANWGADLGAAGTAVVRDLQTLGIFAEARFDERLVGYQFANSVDFIGEDGEPLLDPRDEDGEKILRGPAKHWATQVMVRRFQDQGYGLAYDTEALNHLTSHTAREGAKWPIYGKKDDHTIDARRVQMLRKLYHENGGAIDAFSGGAFVRRAA